MMQKSCQKVSLLVSQSQDRKLSFKENFSLKFHLMMCHGCRIFSEKIQFLRKASNLLSQKIEEGEEFGEGLSSECAKKIKSEIKSNLKKD